MTDPFDRTQLSDTVVAAAPDEAYCSACNQSFAVDKDVCPNDGARLVRLVASRDVLLGRVLDARYELRSEIGRGGMGTVYNAYQISVDRDVAIKVIHPKRASDRATIKRFLREARLATRLTQPNIVSVYDFGQTEDGILYLVMELLRGRTLAQVLDASAALSLARVGTIGVQLCDALEVAHDRGIIHRDLKPSNIIILDDPPGRDLVKVLDFGLAKSLVSDTTSLTTNSDAVLGTPMYMPPEQVDGRPADHRADIYSLGCILHHMVCGAPPFPRDTVSLVLSAQLHDPPPALPDSVPAELADVMARAMAKRPDDRPRSVAELRVALDRARGATSAPALAEAVRRAPSYDSVALAVTNPRHDDAPAPAPAPARSRARVAAILAAGAIAIGAAVGGVVVVARGPHGATPDAHLRAPSDSASIAVRPDANETASVPPADAPVPVDAGRAIDAPRARPVRTPPRDAAVPTPVAPAVDAAAPVAKPPPDGPTIDFYHKP